MITYFCIINRNLKIRIYSTLFYNLFNSYFIILKFPIHIEKLKDIYHSDINELLNTTILANSAYSAIAEVSPDKCRIVVVSLKM